MKTTFQNCDSKKQIPDNASFKSCTSKKSTDNNNHLQALVEKYRQENGNCYDEEDKWWAEKTLTWDKAIERAWESHQWDGKMHGHQYRVGEKKLFEGLQVALADNKQPEDFQDFNTLHDWVWSVAERVKGLGEMTAYDVARRLGVWLGKEPVLVYLHRGTKEGARKFGVNGETVELNAFPPEIQMLGATHAENFLCIYKDQFHPSLRL